MKRVLVNGLKSRAGGGRSILHNYLQLLSESDRVEHYYVLTPDPPEFRRYERPGLEIAEVPELYSHNALFLPLYRLGFPRLLKRLRIDLILNFGDIPIPSSVRQILLFDWAHALYPESLWGRMDFRDRVYFRIKLRVFRAWIRHVDVLVAQTVTAKGRLERLFALDDLEVVPNAVSLDNMDEGGDATYALPSDRTRLLYLSHWYLHKNFEVLLPLARKIRDRKLPWIIVTTIARGQHPAAGRFIEQVERERLTDVIVNLGPIPKESVRSVYRMCDALLMPTLLESFSGSYVEAMYHGLPVLTSDMDFAHDVCGDAGHYFDPLSADSILEVVESAFADGDELERRIGIGRNRVAAMPAWPDVFASFQRLIAEQLRAGEGPVVESMR